MRAIDTTAGRIYLIHSRPHLRLADDGLGAVPFVRLDTASVERIHEVAFVATFDQGAMLFALSTFDGGLRNLADLFNDVGQKDLAQELHGYCRSRGM
jgi:hypothetical protein